MGHELSIIHSGSLGERFRQFRPPDLDSPINPQAIEEWSISLQHLLSCMGLTEQEKVLYGFMVMNKDPRFEWETVESRVNMAEMTWIEFIQEVSQRCYNYETMRTIQKEFDNIQQGSMTVTEAVNKFERLAQRCPHLVLSEEEKIKRMMMMLRPDISVVVDNDNQPPVTMAECVDRAIRVEKRLDQARESRKIFKRKRGNFQGSKGKQPIKSHNNNNPLCPKCGRKHKDECRAGTNRCFKCGMEGHFSRNCYLHKLNQQKPQGSQQSALGASNKGPQAN